MALKYTRPRGTQDVLPQDSWKWQYIEDVIRGTARGYGYGEMRLPTFESTDLFARGVGDGTDIVAKEMYTFEDKGGRSITLRPEGTAGVARAVLENGLLASSPLPLKSYYIQSCFRYEKAQKGRLREFHQFGIECFGTHEPVSDVETMLVARDVFKKLGVNDSITLEINSIGCPKCRPAYNQKLREYFESQREELCPTCKQRLEKNPMRILDCKEEKCQKIAAGAPVMLDYLCEDCTTHFEEVKNLLAEADAAYVINPRIVRGLDYYTNTVFEFIAEGVGTQGTVCAGGRYNGLIEQFGGQPTPAVGYGMGLERLLMLMEEQGKLPEEKQGPLLYAVGQSEAGRKAARLLVAGLRNAGFPAEYDLANRSVKAQMKAAGRLNAAYTVVLGDDEVSSGKAVLKNMETREESEIVLAEGASGFFSTVYGPNAASVGIIGTSGGYIAAQAKGLSKAEKLETGGNNG
ncbi:histidine--tRNA ligase [Ruminococcaceae bacterium OttesenSCG-928-A16]|nr:histidine--tRNA ligase [Ruminococcaceae bacterium OttesenSCG-928-A16]